MSLCFIDCKNQILDNAMEIKLEIERDPLSLSEDFEQNRETVKREHVDFNETEVILNEDLIKTEDFHEEQLECGSILTRKETKQAKFQSEFRRRSESSIKSIKQRNRFAGDLLSPEDEIGLAAGIIAQVGMENVSIGRKELLQCSQFDDRYNKKGTLNMHIVHKFIHNPEKPFHCQLCEYRCNQKEHLRHHMFRHTGVKPFHCLQCGFRCINKGQLKCHILTHTREKRFKCSHCQYCCNKRSHLQRHKMTHIGYKPYHCSYCEYRCNKQEHLLRHTLIHSGEKQFNCEFCCYSKSEKMRMSKRGYFYRNRFKTIKETVKKKPDDTNSTEALLEAEKTEDLTGKEAIVTRSLRVIIKRCDTSSFKFSEQRKRFSTDPKMPEDGPEPGPEPDAGIIAQVGMETTSIDIKKPFLCSQCDYKCSKKGRLKRHMLIHAGEKPFQCSQCQYICSKKAALEQHIRIHTGEKPFRCLQCEYRCTQKGSLTKHMLLHHAVKKPPLMPTM